jgi:hypothetical protein
MEYDKEKRDWLNRVLGIQLGGSDGGKSIGPLMPVWLDAKEEVDARLGKLQSSLRGYDNPDLNRIAEFGLNGVTGTRSVGLMTALREADAAGADAKTRKKLADAVSAYRGFLDTSDVVDLIDDNPFDVAIGLKATLGRALDAIARQIAA